MKKHTYPIALASLLIVLIFATKSEGQVPEKWWTKSSRSDSVQKKILVHASGKYSYTRMRGALSGEMHTGDISLAERKGYFTNFSSYGVDKMDLNLKMATPMIFKSTSHYFTDYIDADLSKIVFGQAGFVWERDDLLLLQNRYSFYAGIGVNVLIFKKLKLKSMGAMGRVNQDYIIPVDNINVIKRPYTAFYCKHNVTFAISNNVSFMGQFYYYTNIADKERYRYGTSMNLSIGIAKHVSLVVGYTYRYERELLLFGASPDNSTQNLGIEVSL